MSEASLSSTASSNSKLIEALSIAQNLIAAGDPLAFQQIQAVLDPPEVEEDPYFQFGEAGEALREAEARGFVYNPDSLEDESYDADDIRSLIGGDFSVFEREG